MGHPSEVDEIFDAISYSKGASVIRMLHNYIGDEVCRLMSDVVSVVVSSLMLNIYERTCLSLSLKDFRKGMNAYLLKFQHKNASTGERTCRKYFPFT